MGITRDLERWDEVIEEFVQAADTPVHQYSEETRRWRQDQIRELQLEDLVSKHEDFIEHSPTC